MKRINPLLFSPLLILTGVTPTLAQVPVKAAGKVSHTIKGGKVATNAVQSSHHVMRAVTRMQATLSNTVNPVGTSIPKAFTPQMSPAVATHVAANAYSPEQLREIARQQDKLLERIYAGHIMSVYNISAKQVFSPYKQSLLRAQHEGNLEMLTLLQKLEGTSANLIGSSVPTRKLGLAHLSVEESSQTIAKIIGYVYDTAIMMYLGYSWGEKPLQEITVPAKYHSARFNQQIDEFLLNHPGFAE